jgi:hypothetical protein
MKQSSKQPIMFKKINFLSRFHSVFCCPVSKLMASPGINYECEGVQLMCFKVTIILTICACTRYPYA